MLIDATQTIRRDPLTQADARRVAPHEWPHLSRSEAQLASPAPSARLTARPTVNPHAGHGRIRRSCAFELLGTQDSRNPTRKGGKLIITTE
jgi:hypothetical protein